MKDVDEFGLCDLPLVAASLFLLFTLAIAAFILLLFIGSPVVIIGIILGLGIFIIPLLLAALLAIISVWYIAYAFLKEYVCSNKKSEVKKPNKKTDYTLNRMKKS